MKKYLSCIAALSLLVSACGSSDADGGAAAVTEELWLLQTRVFVDDGATGYVVPTGKLEGQLSNRQAIEQGGGGMVFAAPGKPDGSFLLGFAERGTLTRYTVDAKNQFEEGIALSFENFGVTSGYGVIAWVDAHTAYWVDTAQLQLIRFDPTDMTVGGAIPIEGTEREGYVTEFSGYPLVREDGVYFPVRWRKEWEDLEPRAPVGAMLVHVDPATDAVTVTSDERCTSLLLGQTTADGDTYWFSDNYNTYSRIIGGAERGAPDCALRMRQGESTFDPDWYLDLGERTAGRPADASIAGPGSSVWLRVYHEEEMAEAPADIDSADTAPAWRWYELDLSSSEPAVENTERPFAGHGGFGLYAGGRSFSAVENADYTETKLLELTDEGFVERLSAPGLIDGIVRVR